jgi:hypothetical protein
VPANGCAAIGPGNPLTPLPVPSSTPAQPSSGSSLSAAKHRKCRTAHHKGGNRKCRKKAKRRK